MSVVRWRAENFARFRGEHELALTSTIYSVVAQRDDDERRSNWSGKTWFLSSFAFAVTGEHPARLEDGWISNGEDFGLLEIETDAGVIIRRSRKRGKSTQVEVLGFGEKVGQKGAALAIREAVGLDRNDFFATCSVEQKKIDQLVSADPAQRHALVSGWLDLAPLARSCQRAADRATAAENALENLQDAVREIDVVLAEFRGEYTDEKATPEEVAAELRRMAADRVKEGDDWEAKAKVEKEHLEAAEENRRLRGAAEEYAEIVRRGKALNGTQVEVPDLAGLETEWARLGKVFDQARHEAETAALVAKGEFDGKCPVDCRQCPVTEDINKAGAAQRRRAKALEEKVRPAALEAQQAGSKLAAAKAQQREADRLAGLLEALRTKARQLKPLADKYAESGEQEIPATLVDYGTLRARATYARQQAYQFEQSANRIDKLIKERAAAQGRLATAEAEVRKWRAAAAILGRNGAQRRCAETGLAEIQNRANQLLINAGIDLSLALSWFREGSDSAKRCGECGAPFPATTTVKQCGNCGTPRGRNLIEKLEVVQSDTSGAADDLTGLVLQIAAAGWLRSRRNAAWDTLLIDEPFGACDEANRTALTTSLVHMVRTGGFSQAFVSAHTRDVSDRMPARIIIRAGSKWSQVEVAA